MFKSWELKRFRKGRPATPPVEEIATTTVDLTRTRQSLADAVVWSILIGLLGLGLAVFIERLPRGGVSLYLFGAFEPSAFELELAALAAVWIFLRFGRWENVASSVTLPALNRMTVLLLPIGTTAFVAIAHFAIYHNYTLSVDEFMTRFGAAAISHGDFLVKIPEDWKRFSIALQPIFTYFSPGYEFWGNPYRPINAAIFALFNVALHADWLANPALAGLSVFLIARVAAHLWPTREDAPVVAALLMATSPQVLANGMTYYAMPAHLAFDLAWLLFFLRGTLWDHATAAVIGFLAIGLHQVAFHPLFVIPFLAPVLFSRRWPLAIFYGAIYAASLLFWIEWYEIALWWSGASIAQAHDSGGDDFIHHVWSLSGSPGAGAIVFIVTNLARFFSWQSVLLWPLALFGLQRARSAPPVVRQAAWGFVIAVIPFLFIFPDQGHGWGYRYLHGLIGNAVLIAVFGWTQVVPKQSDIPRRFALAFGTLAMASLALLGLRCVQMESFIEPYATALGFIRSQDADVVVVDSAEIWFGADLAQNDPYLRNRPKIMSLTSITEAEVPDLCRRDVRLVGLKDVPDLKPNLAGVLADTETVRKQIVACIKAKG